jgi:hypothetical protein
MGRSSTVIRRAVAIGRGRISFLLGLGALIFVPLGLLSALDQEIQALELEQLTDLEVAAALAGSAVHVASALLGSVLYAGAVTIVVINTPPGENPSFRRLIHETPWRLLIWIDVLFTLGSLVSFLLLVVPAIFFFARYVLAAVVAELEGRGVRDSFRRSAELTKGSRRLVLGLLLTVTVVGGFLSELVQAGAAALGVDGFVASWLSSTAGDMLYNPVAGLLSVALVLELGGRLAHPPAAPLPER